MTDASSTSDPAALPALACPGLFYATHSGDGVLSRIRTPGGLVTSEQCRLVAEIAERFAGGVITITNRANLQLRALADRLPADVLTQLQTAGLAGARPEVDHLRNVMASPTAGLDPGAVLDTRPLVRALDEHIVGLPHLAALPAKFSIGLDGGERASIAHLPNDILFRAYRDADGAPRLRVLVRVGEDDGEQADLGMALRPDQVVMAAAALANLYLRLLPADGSKPRLRHALGGRSVQAIREMALLEAPSLSDVELGAVSERRLPWRPTRDHPPAGVHAQRFTDLSALTDTMSVTDDAFVYLGLEPFVAGRLPSDRLRQLSNIAERFGSGSLRLSPWRNVVIPDISREAVEPLQAALSAAGMSSGTASLAAGIVACAGSAGCASGLADTIRDAESLSARLRSTTSTRSAVNIHFTGCEKCCAQRRPASLTLLGRPGDGERYDLYVGQVASPTGDPHLGVLIQENLTPDEALSTVERLVRDFEEEKREGAAELERIRSERRRQSGRSG